MSRPDPTTRSTANSTPAVSPGPDRPRVLLVTAPDATVARRLADGLVERRLAACVNLVPGITSVYRWEGAVQADDEVLLVVKTLAEHVPAIEGHLAAEHPYDCPECVALEVASVEAAYRAWMERAVAAPPPSDPGAL